jgi:hypothetical protein
MKWLIAWLVAWVMAMQHRRLRARVESASEAEGGVTCDLCNDPAWWSANGFSEGERQQMCGPRDLNCPGFTGPQP